LAGSSGWTGSELLLWAARAVPLGPYGSERSVPAEMPKRHLEVPVVTVATVPTLYRDRPRRSVPLYLGPASACRLVLVWVLSRPHLANWRRGWDLNPR